VATVGVTAGLADVVGDGVAARFYFIANQLFDLSDL